MKQFTIKEQFNFWLDKSIIIMRNIKIRLKYNTMKKSNTKEQIKIFSHEDFLYKGRSTSRGFLKLSKKYIGKKVLEIGGGDGSFYTLFKYKYKNKKEIISIDLVPKFKYVRKGNTTQLNFKDCHFNTVVSSDLIEHLNDRDLDKCLSEINRVLKNGGLAIINTINKEDFRKTTITCPECGHKFHRYGHRQIFSEDRIKKLLENKGFKLIKIRKINLNFYAMSTLLTKLIYLFKIDKLLDSSRIDLFFIAEKVDIVINE
ncbi:MAG: class I SAM-dependent methyltransferase [Candidatus Hodarchaeota archaeon]